MQTNERLFPNPEEILESTKAIEKNHQSNLATKEILENFKNIWVSIWVTIAKKLGLDYTDNSLDHSSYQAWWNFVIKTTFQINQLTKVGFELVLWKKGYRIECYGILPATMIEKNDYNSIETNVNEAIENFILRINNARNQK